MAPNPKDILRTMEINQPKTLDRAVLVEQLKVMLALQNSMNELVFRDWVTRKLAWHRAIYVEAAEFIEHIGAWKWWKKGEADWAQAHLELVDIWHFGLAMELETSNANIQASARVFAEQLVSAYKNRPLLIDGPEHHMEVLHANVDRLVAEAGQRRFDIYTFVNLLELSGLSFDALFRTYVGKNMLNRLRQLQGYKAGKYVKTWQGEEDNVHLMRILEQNADTAPRELPDVVLKALEARYQDVVAVR